MYIHMCATRLTDGWDKRHSILSSLAPPSIRALDLATPILTGVILILLHLVSIAKVAIIIIVIIVIVIILVVLVSGILFNALQNACGSEAAKTGRYFETLGIGKPKLNACKQNRCDLQERPLTDTSRKTPHPAPPTQRSDSWRAVLRSSARYHQMNRSCKDSLKLCIEELLGQPAGTNLHATCPTAHLQRRR
jgi:hypothetical protein